MAEERKSPISEDDSLSDKQKKNLSMEACNTEHAALFKCLKDSSIFSFSSCDELRKEFWNCYVHHRGVDENKITAWFKSMKPKPRITAPRAVQQKREPSEVLRETEVLRDTEVMQEEELVFDERS